MLIEDSQFYDNYAESVNSGVTMLSSHLTAKKIDIDYREPLPAGLNIKRVDAGFFMLMLESELVLGENSTISNCTGLSSAVLSASSLSKVTLYDGVEITNNTALSETGNILGLTNVRLSSISKTSFKNNKFPNIQI
mgnify:CR=1 FL=1